MLHFLAFLTGFGACSAFRTPRRSTISVGEDSCIQCLESADQGDAGCDTSCVGKSIECQSCVHWGDGNCAKFCAEGGEGDGSSSTDTTHKPIEEETSEVEQISAARGDAEQNLTASDEALSEHHVNWYDWNSRVSTYFTVGEVCKWDWRRIPTDSWTKNNIMWLARELDNVRAAWGGSIIVNSWYRPPAINRAIGGAWNSQHINGKAVDIRPGNGNLVGLQSWLDGGLWANRALGYGAWCCGFVHIDLRNGRIRWNYR